MMKSILQYLRRGGILFVLFCLALLINHRTGYVTLLSVFILLFGLTKLPKAKFDGLGIAVLLYSVLYILFSSFNGIEYQMSAYILYGICPYIFYMYGRYAAGRWTTENQHLTFWLLIILFYCIDIFVVSGISIVSSGELINSKREFSFTDSQDLSATLVGLCMDIGMIGLPMAILIKGVKLKLSYFSLFVMSLVVTVSLLNRTGLVVLVLCSAGVILWRARKDFSILIKTGLAVAVIFLVLVYVGVINEQLIEFYTARNEDLSTMGHRSYRWTYALSQLFTHPFGWARWGEVYYVHNMWLDIARISGIIPFSFLVFFAVKSFYLAFRLVSRTESVLSYLMLGLNICFFFSCFVEPIFGGTHFMLYIMLMGYENTLYYRSKYVSK